ncbi:MAG: response regulator [Pseudobdellovibrionaceae bacterium]
MKIRYIVVDDAAFLREMIKSLVSSVGGLCVGEAQNGDEALSIVEETLPDLVFLDMVMPGRNGIETAQILKANHPEIKIIGCSTMDQEFLVQRAFESGFDGYLIKPFSKEQLIDTILEVLPHLRETAHGRT